MSAQQQSDAEKYAEHRQQYPDVIEHITEYALEAIHRGKEKWSIYSIAEIIRWERVQDFGLAKDKDGYAFNAHLISYYSREIMMRNPELLGFFETRVGDADLLVVNGETWLQFETR